MKYLYCALLLFFGISSTTNAQDSVYVPDYTMADLSGWNTTTGGTIDVPYVLDSGAPVNGIGSSFNIPYQVQLSGVAGSGYVVPVSGFGNELSFRPNDIGPQPTIGSSFSAVFDIGPPPAPGAGWTFLDDNIRQVFSGFTGSTSNVIAQLPSPFTMIDHGQTGNYVWDVSVGGLGLTNFIGNSPRYDSRGVSFDDGFISNDPTDRTFVSFTTAVPEPSAAVLSLLFASLSFSRRRRVIS